MRPYRGMIKDGKWVYGWYKEDTYGKLKILARHPENHFLHWFFVIPETVGQQVGLKDKNGKDIYEGDIIKSTSEMINIGTGKPTGRFGTEIYHVIYVESEGRFAKQIGRKSNHEAFPLKQKAMTDYYEIIGNIHEKPELLEKNNVR